MFPKSPRFESERWRRAVSSLSCRACFKDGPSQCAHANHRGKGMSMKAPDCFTFPLCPTCHREFDQGTRFGSKLEKRALADEWILSTLLDLTSQGMVKA